MRQTQSGITVIGSSTVSTAADRVRLRIAVEQSAAGAAEALTPVLGERPDVACRTARSRHRRAVHPDHRTLGRRPVGQAPEGAAARAAAYDDAVEQARALAQRSGRTLGEVRSVTTVMPADRPEIYRGQTMAMAKAGSFAPGEIEVAEQVQVSWGWADSTA